MDKYINASIHNDTITDEIQKPDNYQCFNGAWYYKAVSSKDKWLGIEAQIVLPEFTPDDDRFDMIDDNVNIGSKIKRYKDTPSIYVGVSSDFETDIGFAWQRGLVNNHVLEEKITFRPFWRYIYLENGKEKNIYSGTNLHETEYYFFPGDQVKITVVTTKPNFLKFRVELINETKIKKYQEIRMNLKNQPQVLETPEFLSPGNGIRFAEVKRVNAIDQYGNEGKPTQMTKAFVSDCIWKEVYLFRNINNSIVKVPFSEERYLRMLCPNKEAFDLNKTTNQEIVRINPSSI